MSYSPTPRQLELMRFIAVHFAAHGQMPLYKEMMAGIGATVKSDICRLLDGLEERGHLRRRPTAQFRRLDIEILVMPPVSRAPDGAPLFFVAPPAPLIPLQPAGEGA